jgi:hypothetical protein
MLIIPCHKGAVNNISFRQHAVTEFLVEENISAADIFNQLCHIYHDSFMGGSSAQRWVRHFKDGNMDIASLPIGSQPRTTTME